MLTELSMTIKRARLFLVRLKSIYRAEKVSGTIYVWLLAILLIGLGVDYLYVLSTAKLCILIFLTYSVYERFTGGMEEHETSLPPV